MQEKEERGKKAQSNIIVAVLLILIVLVAIAIIWLVVKGVVKEKSEDIDITGFTLEPIHIDRLSR